MEKLRIMCPHCNKYSKLSNPGNFLGKTMTLTCANPACKKKFDHYFEKKPKEDITYLSVKKADDIKMHLRVMDKDGGLVKILNLKPVNYLIGRMNGVENNCEVIQLEDPYVSRRHCLLRCIHPLTQKNYRFVISDLNSTNKTFLNREELNPEEEIYLEDGDVINVGEIEIIYREVENK